MWQAKWRCLWHFASWVPGVHLSSGRSAPFWPLRCSRVASWAVHSVYPVFPKHGPLQTGRFWAVYFLLKQSGITTKCNATKHALSSPWPSETFTRSRIASIKVSALHLQMLCANALWLSGPDDASCYQFRDLSTILRWTEDMLLVTSWCSVWVSTRSPSIVDHFESPDHFKNT